MTSDYFKLAVDTESSERRRSAGVKERANLIVQMLIGNNAAARSQAIAAVERGCHAEELLAVIRSMPSREELLTNAAARAMWERAGRLDA